ncbi:hypothetical protein OIO90_003734 [Microbotryomycetes sp. JL221]|nr:hypothetical protein OIO90_003734 [Microbotryomycetes sp. JL221]
MNDSNEARLELIAVHLDDGQTNLLKQILIDRHRLSTFVGPIEADRISKLRLEADQCRSLIGQLVLRDIVVRSYRVSPSELVIQRTSNAKPFISHASVPADFDFNVSHDSDWIVVGALLPQPLSSIDLQRQQLRQLETESFRFRFGVDVMRVAVPWADDSVSSFTEIVRTQLTFREYDWIVESYSRGQRVILRRLFAIWTLKEAYTKATGHGLTTDLRTIEFKVGESTPGQFNNEIECRVAGLPTHDWTFHLHDQDAEHIVAIAINIKTCRIPKVQVTNVQELLSSDLANHPALQVA